MKKLTTLFTCSSSELKQVRTITACAMLASVSIVLGAFRITLGNSLRIGFAGIPNQIGAYLFGPVVSSLYAGALDIVNYMIKPVGAFFPGLTLVTMLSGLIYGVMFYRRPLKLSRVLAANLVVCLVCNVLLNTLCLSILNGTPFFAELPIRAVKNVFTWLMDSCLFYSVAKMLETAGAFRILKKNSAVS